MLKRIIPFALLGSFLIASASCNKGGGGFKTTKDGVEYKIVRDEPGTQKAALGDIIEYTMIVKVGDSVLADYRVSNGGKPMMSMLQKMPGSNPKSDPTDVITMLTVGDSVIIRAEIDSMTRQRFTFAKPTDKFEYQFKLVSAKTRTQFEQEEKNKAGEQAKIDDQLLTEYFAKNNIKAEKTASGLYYVISTPGSGANPTPGQTVKVNYTGRTLDGNVFDSNMDPKFQHVEPLEFPIGQGRVIPGWDEGIALLKKGGKGVLYVPSGLAYGAHSPNPNIPDNAILMFDVELVDAK